MASLSNPPEINLITLNCWGLKYIAAHRHARLCAIGDELAASKPVPDIVALQECWTQADYLAIHDRTKHILPHAKFYHSGILGSGLVVLSRWPITGSSMYQYPLNGRPTAFFRGDWFVGKGVACTTITVPPGGFLPRDHPSVGSARDTADTTIALFNTHLHAPYEAEPHDSYLAHRTAQAWEIAKLLRAAAERGHLALAAGDFNMLPDSLAHQLVVAHGGVTDAWRAAHPTSRAAEHAARADSERQLANVDDTTPAPAARASSPPRVSTNLALHGTTCDSAANTWRWPASLRRRLASAPPDSPLRRLDGAAPDAAAKRLDYVFVGNPSPSAWSVASATVGTTARHARLGCSLSDHFSVAVTLRRTDAPTGTPAPAALLAPDVYSHVLALTDAYAARERRQRVLRLGHFVAALAVAVGCHVGVWWAAGAAAGAAFALMLVSSVGLAAGVVDGLIGGLFVAWEMSALREFRWEVRLARERAVRAGEGDDDDDDDGGNGGHGKT